MKKCYKIEKTLGVFKAIPANETEMEHNNCFEIEDFPKGHSTHGEFTCLYYSNGERSDITLGNWIFSGVINGEYQVPHSYTRNQSICYEISGITPNNEQFFCYYNKSTYEDSELFLSSFYTLLWIISSTCNTKDEAFNIIKFKTISNNEIQWHELKENLNTLNTIRNLINNMHDSDIKSLLRREWNNKFEAFKNAINDKSLLF